MPSNTQAVYSLARQVRNTVDGRSRKPLYRVKITVNQFGTEDRDRWLPDRCEIEVAMREREYNQLRAVIAKVLGRPVEWNWVDDSTREAVEELTEGENVGIR